MNWTTQEMNRKFYFIVCKDIAKQYPVHYQQQITMSKMFGKLENAQTAFTGDDSHILCVEMPVMMVPNEEVENGSR